MDNELISSGKQCTPMVSEKGQSLQLARDLVSTFRELPAEYKAAIIFAGILTVAGLGGYAIHQGVTVNKTMDGWSLSVKTTAARSA